MSRIPLACGLARCDRRFTLRRLTPVLRSFFLLLLFTCETDFAGSPPPVIDDRFPAPPPSLLTNPFGVDTLSEDKGLVRSIAFHGRYEGQYVDSSDDFAGGSSEKFWEHRRSRAGLIAELAGDLRFIHTWNLDTSPNFDGDHFFDKIWDLNLRWSPSDEWSFVIGKQRPIVTREWETPSYRLLTIERSPIVNNVISLPLWGASVVHEREGIVQQFGVYGTALEMDYHLPSFEHAGSSLLYRNTTPLSDAATLFFEFQFNDTATSSEFSETYGSSAYEEVASLGSESRWSQFAFTANLIAARDRRDFTMDDTWGFVLMPSVDLNDRLEAVMKVTYAEDLRVDRPERYASRPLVDGYASFYVGLNYRIFEDHLKLMAGYEVANGEIVGTGVPYANESWVFAVRTLW